jgi:hypothetical protein
MAYIQEERTPMPRKPPPDATFRLGPLRADGPEAPMETEAAYRARINREIEEGLRDLEAGNVVSREEHEAEMDRFMTELRQQSK